MLPEEPTGMKTVELFLTGTVQRLSMQNGLLGHIEQPEYTGENRCTPCTLLNVLIAIGFALLVGQLHLGVGLLAFLGSVALIYLRGYLVPGTPELTKRYLPASALALFGKDERPEPLEEPLTQHAKNRAASDETTDDGTAESPEEALEELLERPMDAILESFGVVREGEDDLVLVETFREQWEQYIETLADESEQGAALAAVFEAPPESGEIEHSEGERYYGNVDGSPRHSWITEAAMISDLAANRVLEAAGDPRWTALEPEQRLSILRGFRVFLMTCPACGGPVSPTEDTVESCCSSWNVVAIECADCETRVLELPAPEEQADDQPPAGDPNETGLTR